MEFVMNLCDRLVVLDFGEVIARGTPDEVRDDPLVQRAYLGDPATRASAGGGDA
jgi:branched-chain amino acid transport system ATP-binding protein